MFLGQKESRLVHVVEEAIGAGKCGKEHRLQDLEWSKHVDPTAADPTSKKPQLGPKKKVGKPGCPRNLTLKRVPCKKSFPRTANDAASSQISQRVLLGQVYLSKHEMRPEMPPLTTAILAGRLSFFRSTSFLFMFRGKEKPGWKRHDFTDR